MDYQAAQSAFDEARRKVQQELANVNAAEANVQAKQSHVIQAGQRLYHRADIKQPGIVAAEELSNYRSALDAAKYALSIAEQQLAAQRAIAGDIASNPEIRAAKTALDRARFDLDRTVIRAPVDGIVAQLRVQIGQRIATASELMTIVPSTAFCGRELQGKPDHNIRLGQPVTLTSDICGRSRIFHRRVEGGRRDGRRLCHHPATKRDRQLNQGRAASACPHCARSQRAPGQSIARRHFHDGRCESGSVRRAAQSACIGTKRGLAQGRCIQCLLTD